MDAALARALFLLCIVLYAAWRWHARICQGHLPHPAPPGEEQLATMFRRKRLYRLGVLACCLLALGVYYLGLPRLAAVALLGCGGLCQYGVWRERTLRFFPVPAPEARASASPAAVQTPAPGDEQPPASTGRPAHPLIV